MLPARLARPGLQIKTARQILAERGFKGFFAGIEVAIVRAFPANAALFVGYEITRSLLEKA
jgi:hypothetical protein